ncbi:PAAR domain-containing protein [Calothrix sp. CCY 0018]|uniref:PAAR domain-containing protein n=1 Tax=Calothrix sp. CCY 0018 TaxID=3103864 RepID=UPI0039C68A0C
MPKGKPAARITDTVAHPLPPVLTGGPGSRNVLIGKLPAWRGIPATAVPALMSAKKTSDIAVKTAETASKAASGTPAAPGAIAAEQSVKTSAAATMSNAISLAAASAAPSIPDIHQCATPLPIPPHGPGVVINGSKTVLINGLPACRMGDTIIEALGPPNKITKGDATVLIGN